MGECFCVSLRHRNERGGGRRRHFTPFSSSPRARRGGRTGTTDMSRRHHVRIFGYHYDHSVKRTRGEKDGIGAREVTQAITNTNSSTSPTQPSSQCRRLKVVSLPKPFPPAYFVNITFG